MSVERERVAAPTTYRVPGHVRPKAVCVFRRGEEILVAESQDSVKGDTFFGPPGGQIEFGETAAQAARREMLEELGANVTDLALLGVLENIFTYEGQSGHEIVFVFEASFQDPTFYSRAEIHGIEGQHAFVLTWERTDDFARGGSRLVPDGLYQLLGERR